MSSLSRRVTLSTLVAACVAALPVAARYSGREPAPSLPVLAAATTPANGPHHHLHSRPAAVPAIAVEHASAGAAPGLVLANARSPRPGVRMGPMIFDRHGRVRWFHRLPDGRASVALQRQSYRGRPVLTWGERPPLGEGSPRDTYFVIADARYRVLERLRIRARGTLTDLHEFVITSRDTALMLGLRRARRDLTALGRSRNAVVLENVVQEVDIRSGRVLLTWSSLRHVGVRESAIAPRPGRAFDYLHVNSISEDSDGHLLLSARHTNAVYKIHRRSGRVAWRLGGRRSSFRMGRGAVFRYQHDAQRLPDGTIQLFDNASSDFDRRARQSRVLRLRLDHRRRRATVARQYTHPDGVLAVSQANARRLPNGNVFVGWGSEPRFSEFAPDGRLVWDATLPSRAYQSYRGFKADWVGRPATSPTLTAGAGGPGRTLVFASWNGATEVARWRVLGGVTRGALRPVGTARWSGLETRITLPGRHGFVAVDALDASGRVLARSRPAAVQR